MAVIILKEPFNNFTDIGWTVQIFTIVGGGQTGTGAQGGGASEISMTIPEATRNARYAFGFAYKAANLTANHSLCQFRYQGPSGINNFCLVVNTSGAIEARRGNAAGTVLATSAINLITVGTFNYVECAVTIADAGLITVWVDGAVAIGPDFAADTIVSANGLLMDTFVINNTGTGSPIFDNLYLTSGAAATRLGAQTLTAPYLWSPQSLTDFMYQQLSARYPALGVVALDDLLAKFATDNPTFIRPVGDRTFYSAVDPETLADAAMRYWTNFVP